MSKDGLRTHLEHESEWRDWNEPSRTCRRGQPAFISKLLGWLRWATALGRVTANCCWWLRSCTSWRSLLFLPSCQNKAARSSSQVTRESYPVIRFSGCQRLQERRDLFFGFTCTSGSRKAKKRSLFRSKLSGPPTAQQSLSPCLPVTQASVISTKRSKVNHQTWKRTLIRVVPQGNPKTFRVSLRG